MGLIVATSNTSHLTCNNPFLMNGIELLHLTNSCMRQLYFNSLVDGHENMSHMTCCDQLIHS